MNARTRVAIASAVAGLLGGGGLAGGVAEASGGGPARSATKTTAVTTASVVRTTLIATTQVGGSLGYSGSYTIVNPAGASAQQVTQAQQQLAQAQAAVATDHTSDADTDASDAQAINSAQTSLNAAGATLVSDQSKQSTDCAGQGASSPTCAQDGPKVSQDQAQLAQAQDGLASARLNATKSVHQDEAKLATDTAQLQNAQAALATLEQNAANPGTTYTSLPAVGQVISQNQPLYAINGQVVPLLYGSVPLWRDFRLGMSDGPDVGELTQDLIALGFGSGLTAGNHYSAAAAAAVQRWQASLGLAQTGVILLGEVMFEAGAIRVTAVTPNPGQGVAPGPVLTATSTTRVVTVALSVTQEYLVKPGNAVTVVLPDGQTTVPGHVQAVSTVAQTPPSNNNSNPNNSNTPTVTVTITLDDPAASGSLEQAPVNVNITTQKADNVLAVPINALLALEEGGDGVDVVSGASHQLVAVQTGLYSSTMVQVSGPGITEGTQVEVPSQ